MSRYILRRLALMIPVAFLASVILFVLLKLTPGDPVLVMLGERATAENYEAVRRELGLDQPYPIQYLRWASHIVQGDLGKSLQNGSPVRDEIVGASASHLPAGYCRSGVEPGRGGAAWAFCRPSFVARRWASSRPRSRRSASRIPGFFVGLVLIYFFAAQVALGAAGRVHVVRRQPRRLAATPHPAGHHAQPVRRRHPDALHSLRAARHAASGLHPYRPRQGLRRGDRDPAPRACATR